VRLAAACALAYHRDPAGEDLLIEGLGHDRWEVRWWCGKLLTYLGGSKHREAIARRRGSEPDSDLRKEMDLMVRSFP
jgi:HEAT repeat protein